MRVKINRSVLATSHSRLLSILLIAMVPCMACRTEPPTAASAIPASTPQANAQAVATATASPAPLMAVKPSPNSVPTTPFGPVGQATPMKQLTPVPNPPQGEMKTMMGNIPVTVSAAKPALTPAPDPFPARPTPTIVIKDGQIQQQWEPPVEAASLVSPVKDQPDAARIGREYYLQKCVDCHGKEGKGNGWLSKTLLKPPTNLSSQMVQANTDGGLYWKITNGKSPMPAHRIRFTDEQRWYIVAYLRTLKP